MSDEPVIRIANEFAEVRIRKVFTRNGERCEIEAPRLGRRVQLDALVLESLAAQDPEAFSRFLAAHTERHNDDDQQ